MTKRVHTPSSPARSPGGDAGSSGMTRRQFLVRGTGAMAALSLGGVACSEDATGPSGPLRIAVVGAGLSGLVAAYELDRAGHDVTVLEARAEAGGRARTFRDPFDDGLFAEAGPARIPPHHDWTLGYIDHFGLPTDPFYPPEGLYLVSDGAGGHITETYAEHVGDRLGGREDWVKIRGGIDLLPAAFADALGQGIRYGSPVSRIQRGGSGATVTFETGAGADTLEADRVLVTVPLPVMDRIVFEPALSAEKRTAMANLGYQDVTRVYVQYAQRVWEGDGYNGWGRRIDRPEEFWHPTWDLAGPRGILMSYMFSQTARDAAALAPQERIETFIGIFEELFPGTAAVAEKGHSISWRDQPWIGGAFAEHHPRFAGTPELASPEGEIHFAGEHASDVRGWMQGALASGLRAAQEIDGSVAPAAATRRVVVTPAG